jgi:hypothetical protein
VQPQRLYLLLLLLLLLLLMLLLLRCSDGPAAAALHVTAGWRGRLCGC